MGYVLRFMGRAVAAAIVSEALTLVLIFFAVLFSVELGKELLQWLI